MRGFCVASHVYAAPVPTMGTGAAHVCLVSAGGRCCSVSHLPERVAVRAWGCVTAARGGVTGGGDEAVTADGDGGDAVHLSAQDVVLVDHVQRRGQL